MSEDCHDSNNADRTERDADMALAVPCTECGEPVFPFEAYPVEITRPS